MKTLTSCLTCVVLTAALTAWAMAPSLAPEGKGLLEHQYLETVGILQEAGKLLDRSRRGDSEAMYQLGVLFYRNQNLAEMWLYHGAIHGHEDAAVRLIYYYIRDPEPLSYRSGYAWLQTSWKLGYLGTEPVVLSSGSLGEHRHDEAWFIQRMTGDEIRRASRLSELLLRRTLNRSQKGQEMNNTRKKKTCN